MRFIFSALDFARAFAEVSLNFLLGVWHDNFTLPDHGRRNPHEDNWRWFLFYWLWSIAAATPSALIAAYLIGRMNVTDQHSQDILSVAFTFCGMVLAQLLIFGISALIRLPHEVAKLVAPNAKGCLWTLMKWVAIGAFFFIQLLGPFALAGLSVYIYFAHPPQSIGEAETGAAGALVLKVAIILFNSVVAPAIKAVFLKGLWQLLKGGDKAKPRGA